MATLVHKDDQYVRASGSRNGGTLRKNFTLTTTDATATVIASFPVAELEAVKVQGHVVGMLSDASAVVDGICDGGWRRAASGNVTANGTPVATAREDHGTATPTFAWNANTTAQTVELKVTGVASETWHWEASLSVTRIK